MDSTQILSLYYILFIWMVLIHTMEEISQEIFDAQIGHIHVTKGKYLFGASMITTLNLTTLALIVSGIRAGLYLGIFTSLIFGIFQAVVHTIGYLKEGRKAKNLGAGFYSALPLAAVGALLLVKILQAL